MKKKIAVVMTLVLIVFSFAGCNQADRVSSNISKEADNFNVIRRLTVINARTDKPVFELIAAFSLANNSTNELTVTCQTGPDEYKKHFVYLNQWTIYVVEDVSGASVSPFRYEINFLPEMILPVEVTNTYSNDEWANVEEAESSDTEPRTE